jgi:hypothetical protein
MADQNITELPIKTNTGIASTDYMLGIDSAEGYQILVRDVAKYIVENYNGSTILGSAQTVKDAFTSLKNSAYDLSKGTVIPSGANLDTYFATPGTYYSPSATITNSLVNCPITGVGFKLIVKETGYTSPSFVIQEIYRHDSTDSELIYCRAQNASSQISDWVLQPSRSEITALNSNIDNCLQQVAVAGNGQGDYTFPSGKFGFCIWAIGTSTAGLTFLYATGSGLQAVKVTATSTSNNPTFTYSNGVLTIKNTGSSYMRGSLVFT